MKKLRVVMLFAIILIVFGCSDKSPTENDPDPGDVILSDETVVLEETQVNQDLQQVSQDGSTFTFANNSTTDDFEEGDILVSGITDLMPNGFLRKITNVQENSNTVTVTTEIASLDEALQQGGLSASYTFLPSRIENSTFAEGVHLISNSREDLFSLVINKVFYDADGNLNTTDDQIKVVGTLNFTAEMLMNIEISNWQLNEFDIQLVNTFERDLTFENSVAYNLQEELNIVELNFPVITFFIGIVPVTIHPTINVDAYVDASLQAGISFGVTAIETMTTGAMYENNTWSPISSYEKTLGFNGPNGYGSINVQAGLKPQLQTMIYDFVGPYIVLDAYGKFDCSVEVSYDDLLISEEILFGLNLDAGLLIEILSHTIVNFYMDIYDDEWILHQYEYTIGQAPVVTITNPSNGSQFDLGATIDFEGNATDVQDGDLTGNSLEWVSNVDGSIGFGANLSVSDLTQGPHTITLIATDSDNYTDEDDVSINILGTGNNPPSMPFDPSPSDDAINVSINTDLSWNCTDPEGDPLTYNIYFGTTANPTLFEEDWTQNTFDLSELLPEETYYWKIEAFDDHDNSTTGEIWAFTTFEQGSGIVAYYPFNGNVYDESVNDNDGIEHGDIQFTSDRFGNTNQAIYFDGVDDYIEVEHSGDFDWGTGSWAVAGWYNFSAIGNMYRLVTKRSSSSPYQGIYLQKRANDKICFQAGDWSNPYGGNYLMLESSDTIEVDTWYFVVMQRTDSQIELWINNNLDNYSSSTGWNWNVNNTHSMNIGTCRDANQHFHNGKIDDLRFFNHSLSDSEINDLYHEDGWNE